MKINIGSIRELFGGILEFKEEFSLDVVSLAGQLGMTAAEPIKVQGKITNIGEGFLVEGTLQFEGTAMCSRCLQSFTVSREIKFAEEFVRGFDRSEDDSSFGFQGDIIDLTECLSEQIVLSLPMRFLCREDCQGICQICGVNLNSQKCSCSDEKIDARFELLKSLLSKERGEI